MENISFQYSGWFISFCFLGGLLYAALLYWNSQKIDGKIPWLQPVLSILRFLPIVLIGILLLGPVLKQIIEESKQPSIVILQDNSKSISSWADRANVTELQEAMSSLKVELSQKYNVATYRFGEYVSLSEGDTLDYSDDITNLSNALEYVNDVFEGENLGAVIVATDGIYNAGQNPLYAGIPNNIPIHSIALGDTTRRKDASVQTVLYNEVAYLNDQMLTQVDIRAVNGSNQALKLTVEKESANGYVTIDTRNITIEEEDFFHTEDISLTFDDVGIIHYRYRISTINNEINLANNRKDIYIEVLDARQEIGIIAASPHPDISALKQLLEQNKNFKVRTYLEDPSSSELAALDLVIFHNVPNGSRNLSGIINSLDNRKTPRLFIVGSRTNLPQFNQVQSLITITGKGGSTNDAQGDINEAYENFVLSESLKTEISRFPPLSAPFGAYEVNGNVTTLLYQKIGDITTDFPLLSFADEEGIKTAYLFGNDIWRWKLFDYLQNENFDLITELIDKTIIYTSTKEDKRKFRVSVNNNVFMTNQDVMLTGELYNNSYELVNNPEVLLQLTGTDGNTFNYTFSRNNKSYILDIGKLTPGSYSYQAETIFNGEQYIATGKFVVREVQYELYDLEAHHNLLYALSRNTNGSVTYPDDIGALAANLVARDNIKPIIYQNIISKPLLDNKWLFLILILPLILEWLLRRYFGSL